MFWLELILVSMVRNYINVVICGMVQSGNLRVIRANVQMLSVVCTFTILPMTFYSRFGDKGLGP